MSAVVERKWLFVEYVREDGATRVTGIWIWGKKNNRSGVVIMESSGSGLKNDLVKKINFVF